MKKFIALLLVLSLAFSPIFSLGQRAVGLKTIFLPKDSNEVKKSLNEKPTVLSNQAQKLEKDSTELKNSQENSITEMTTEEIITEITSTSKEAGAINQGTLRALAVIQSENTTLKAEIEDVGEYVNNLEVDLADTQEMAQKQSVELAEKQGNIETLEEKLKAKKSYKTLLLGADYNLKDGYSVGLDFGVKFDGGLTTQVGVKAPIKDINPVGLLDINSYTFSTKIGWSW